MSINTSAENKAINLENIVNIDSTILTSEHLVLIGTSLTEFNFTYNSVSGGKIVFLSGDHSSSFLAVAPRQDSALIKLHFKSSILNREMILQHESLPKDNLDIVINLISSGDAWRCLNCFTKFSQDWHIIANSLPLEYIASFKAENNSGSDYTIIQALKKIRLNLGAEGWQGSIDGFDSSRITGWANRPECHAPQKIDIYVNDFCLAHNLPADHYRQDLLEAGIGNGYRSFEMLLNHGCFDSDVLAVSLRAPETGKIFAWRIFYFQRSQLIYKGNIDRIEPIIRGWFITDDLPDRTFAISFYIDDVLFGHAFNDKPRPDLAKAGITSGRGGFELNSPWSLLAPGQHILRLQAHGSRVIKEMQFEAPGRRSLPLYDLSILDKRISIVIPFYNDPCLEECIERIIQYTPEHYRIIIVDDCSTSEDAARILQKYRINPNIFILRNKENLNFSASVNIGIEAAGNEDVVILNSDARVTPGWLRSLLLTAVSQPKVATVTPLSDRAGVFSAPEPGNNNPLPEGVSEENYSRAFRVASFGIMPEVPTGHGFCMYISRACLDEIRGLDAVTFKKIYGEENDFCMRALKAGWHNLVDDRSYVFHERLYSFTPEKIRLMELAADKIKTIHPEYPNALSVFKSAPFDYTRYIARYAIRHWKKLSRPGILYVNNIDNGGTSLTNQDLMKVMSAYGRCYLLQSDARKVRLFAVAADGNSLLEEYTLANPIEPISHISREADGIVSRWLFEYDISVMHIRNLIWNSLGLISAAKKLGCKVIYSFHDFYALSPNLKLVDDSGVFLGSDFVSNSSQFRETLWKRYAYGDLPSHDEVFQRSWIKRFTDALGECDAYVTTSQAAAQLISQKMSSLITNKIHIIQHGRDFGHMLNLKSNYSPGKPIKILALNSCYVVKGAHIFEALAKYDLEHLQILEFHALGNIPKENSLLKQHGPYERDKLAEKVAAIEPHMSAIFSVWGETWCHTLTESWAMGLPVIVFDLGAQAERVKETGAGWVLPILDIPELYRKIIDIAVDIEAQKMAELAVARWQAGWGLANTCALMGLRYGQLYRQLLVGEEAGSLNIQRKFSVICIDNLGICGLSRQLQSDFWLGADSLAVNPGQLKVYLEKDMVASVTFMEGSRDSLGVAQCRKLASEKGVPVFDVKNQSL